MGGGEREIQKQNRNKNRERRMKSTKKAVVDPEMI